METSVFFGTAWSLLPPIVAIILAFITKEVYSSLFAGIFVGALLCGNFHPWTTFELIFSTMAENIDMNIVFFLVMLGMIVVLMEMSGGSAAYGRWASAWIKNKPMAMLATSLLGVLIFVDDYFNCLTVGSVMRPITDRYKVSRAKLAYLIDATAAPICIIAPISSWAAAVNSYVPEGAGINGFQMFIRTIPYNLYALLTIFMLIFISAMNFDFGLMGVHEKNAKKGDLFTDHEGEFDSGEKLYVNERGKVYDLLLPIIVLIVSAVGAMIYTGFKAGGVNIQDAFANCDSSLSLVFSTFVTIIFTLILYIPRKILTFKQYMDSFIGGFRLMLRAIAVLTFAWTLKGVTNALGVSDFVSDLVSGNSAAAALVPVIMFAIAIFISFSTGTSWGTFAILVPIAVAIFSGEGDLNMMILAVSAVLAGSVCGDHLSPISDTTIMSSAGAQCYHMNHVSTQMQYAIVPIVCSVIGYLIAGAVRNWFVPLAASILLETGTLMFIRKRILDKGTNSR